MEIGLATMRRDGFAYLSRKVEGSASYFETAPLMADGPVSVFFNVEGVSTEAPLVVELLDDSARPIPGFSGDKAVTISEPGTRQPVAWGQPLPKGKPLAFRVSFPDGGDARVFAINVDQPES